MSTRYLSTLGAGALALLVNVTAHAQWTTAGPSPLGGTIFQGSGNTGPLSDTTSPALTFTGGDQITLDIGGFATGSLVDTIVINGPNTLLTNHGTIQGDAGFYAVDLFNSNETVVSDGSILGGDGTPDTGSGGGAGGIGVVAANVISDLNAISITNNGGMIRGGNGGAGAGTVGGTGGAAIFLETNANITNFNLANSGSIVGGDGGSDATGFAGNGGDALQAFSTVNITNFVVNNSGIIQGGNGGAESATGAGALGGAGLDILAQTGSVDGFALNNSGLILGGTGGANGIVPTTGVGGVGGAGINILAETSINDFSVTNSGTIAGGAGGIGGDAVSGGGYGRGGDALTLKAVESDIEGFTLNNSGLILGGAGSDGGYENSQGGNAVAMYVKQGSINNVLLTNSGVIAGGKGGSSTYLDGYGYDGGGDAIYMEVDNGGLNGLTLNNTGTLLGGAGGSTYGEYGTYGGYGFYLYANTSVTNVVLNNSGSIIGGNGGDALGDYGYGYGNGYGGNAIEVGSSIADISGFSLKNSGLIKGGNGGTSNYESGGGGEGLYLVAAQNITNVLVENSGRIIGGNSADANGLYAYDMGNAGAGLNFEAHATLSNLVLNNSGLIKGGNGGNAIQTAPYEDAFGGIGGHGMFIFANNAVSNVHVNNSGTIIGGNGGSINAIFTDTYTFEGNNGGEGILVATDTLSGLTINNFAGGIIAGGNGGNAIVSGGPGNGGRGGDGIDILTGGINTGNIVLNNFGTIRGGNAGSGDTSRGAGTGVYVAANGSTINNYGVISAGKGANPVAVDFEGASNTLNLNGHSEIHGAIVATGNSNNVLNLNFTGLSPAAQAQITAQIVSQGNLNNWSGTFTVRGVTYTVDPLIIRLNMSSYQQLGITPNQQAVGANLDSFIVNPTGDMLNLLNAIDVSGDMPLSLEALSPQPYQLFSDIAISNATFMTLSIDARLNNLRDGSESIDTMGIGGNTDKTTAGFSKDGKSVVVPEAKSLEKRWGFFATGDGLFANVDAHGGDLSDAGFTSAGLTLGVDGKINDNWVAGLLFDYSYTVADLDNHGSKANVETFGGGVYAGYHNAGWYGNGLATYGHNNYDSTRNITFPGINRAATGSTDGNQYVGNIDGGYDFKVSDKITAGPLVGLQYVHLDVDSFNESGAGAANLAVGSQSVDSLRSRLGVHAEYKTQIAKEVAFATEIRAAWQHEFLDDSRSISGQFIGSGLGAFNVQTTKPQRDSALAGVGANVTVRDTMTLFFDYDVQAGQSSYLEQSVKGGVKFSF